MSVSVAGEWMLGCVCRKAGRKEGRQVGRQVGGQVSRWASKKTGMHMLKVKQVLQDRWRQNAKLVCIHLDRWTDRQVDTGRQTQVNR